MRATTVEGGPASATTSTTRFPWLFGGTCSRSESIREHGPSPTQNPERSEGLTYNPKTIEPTSARRYARGSGSNGVLLEEELECIRTVIRRNTRRDNHLHDRQVTVHP